MVNDIKETIDSGKNNSPLQARVDDFYKDLFEKELKKNPGMKKKNLMESMIYDYIKADEKSKKEKLLNFSSEISLITTELDNILNVFKNIASKSQDTVGSQKNYYEQSLKNLNDQLNAAKLSISNLADKNKLLEEANNGFMLEKNNLIETIDSLKDSSDKKNSKITELKIKSNELLEEIRSLKNIEKENVQLQNKLNTSSEDIKKLENINYEKDSQIHNLNSKVSELENDLKNIKLKYDSDINDISSKIRKELDLDKKTEILDLKQNYNDLQIKFNNLQMECIKNLNNTSSKNKKSKSPEPGK